MTQQAFDFIFNLFFLVETPGAQGRSCSIFSAWSENRSLKENLDLQRYALPFLSSPLQSQFIDLVFFNLFLLLQLTKFAQAVD